MALLYLEEEEDLYHCVYCGTKDLSHGFVYSIACTDCYYDKPKCQQYYAAVSIIEAWWLARQPQDPVTFTPTASCSSQSIASAATDPTDDTCPLCGFEGTFVGSFCNSCTDDLEYYRSQDGAP